VLDQCDCHLDCRKGCTVIFIGIYKIAIYKILQAKGRARTAVHSYSACAVYHKICVKPPLVSFVSLCGGDLRYPIPKWLLFLN